MKFLLLLYGDAAAEAAMTDDERRAIVDQHIAFRRHLAERSAQVIGEALAPPEAGRTVRFDGERMIVTDGPFLETKEALGGFYVLEAESIEEAAELVVRCRGHPASSRRSVRSSTCSSPTSVRQRAPSRRTSSTLGRPRRGHRGASSRGRRS